MSRYAEVADELARSVRGGSLHPGDELPAVREAARRYATTASTITRAYRRLADAGVISVGDRRRAGVAADGAVAAARLLDGDRVFRLAGSDDPGLHLALQHAGPGIVLVPGAPGSFQGLRALSRGDADGAAVHLRHRDGEYNAPFATSLLRDRDPHVLHLWRREQGLILPMGNPGGVAGPADLSGLRIAKREAGAGTRVLLEQLLLAEDIDPAGQPGPEFSSHLEIGLAVASGIADVGLGLRAAAMDLDLDFLPLLWESYEVVLPGDLLGGVAALRQTLHSRDFTSRVTALGGYDMSNAGDLRRPAAEL